MKYLSFILYWSCVIIVAMFLYVYLDGNGPNFGIISRYHASKLKSYDGVDVVYDHLNGYRIDIKMNNDTTRGFLDLDGVISRLKNMRNVQKIAVRNVDSITREQISDLCSIDSIGDLRIEAKSVIGESWRKLNNQKHSMIFLVLKGEGLSDDDLIEIAKITTLYSLAISNANVSIKGIEPLLALHNLAVVFRETTFYGDTSISTSSDYLRVYALENCDISSSDLHFLKSLKRLGALRIFSTALSSEHLHQITLLESVHSFRLWKNGITSIDTDMFPFDKWHELGDLMISNNKISTIPQLLHKCQMLRKIDMSGNELDDDALENFPFLENLEELNLSNNPIKGTKMDAIKALPKLKILNLNDTLIDDETKENIRLNRQNYSQ